MTYKTYNTPPVLGYTKREFTAQIEGRIRSVTQEIDVLRAEDVAEAMLKAFTDSHDEIEQLRKDLEALAGFDVLRYHNSDEAPVRTVHSRSKKCEIKSPSWRTEPKGRLLEILKSNGWPDTSRTDAEPTLGELADPLLLLTGALATSKVRYWDLLYPPTKVFVDTLAGDDIYTAEVLAGAITTFALALR